MLKMCMKRVVVLGRFRQQVAEIHVRWLHSWLAPTDPASQKPGSTKLKPKTPVKAKQNVESKVETEAAKTQSDTSFAASPKESEENVKQDTSVMEGQKEQMKMANLPEVSTDEVAIDDSTMENEEDLEEMDEIWEDHDQWVSAGESFDNVEGGGLELLADMDEEEFTVLDDLDMEKEEHTHEADISRLQEMDHEEKDQQKAIDADVSTEKVDVSKVKEEKGKKEEDKAVDGDVKKENPKDGDSPSVKEEVKKEDEVKPTTNPVIRPNLKQILENDTSIIEIVIGRYATMFNKEECLHLIKEWKSEKLEMTLEELLKKFEEKEGALTLSSNALFKAKQAQNRKRRVLKVCHIPKDFGKEGVQNLFSQFGKVLAFSFVGIRYPLESVLLTMDTEESCNSAIAALDGKPVEGYPKSKIRVQLNPCADDIKLDSPQKSHAPSEPRELKGSRKNRPACSEREKSRERSSKSKRSSSRSKSADKNKTERVRYSMDEQLDKLTGDLLEFYEGKKDWVYNHLKRVFGSQLVRGTSLSKKSLVSEAFRTPYAIVKDSAVECDDWKEEEKFISFVKSTNKATKRLWEVADYFVGHLDYFCRNFKEILKDREMSDDKIVKLVMKNHPEVQPKPETIEKFNLPDMSYQWLLMHHLPPDIGAAQLNQILRKIAVPERIVILRRESTSAVVKMASTKHAEIITVKLRGRMLRGAHKTLRIVRYTGPFAAKDRFSDRYSRKTSSSPSKSESSSKKHSSTVTKSPSHSASKTEDKIEKDKESKKGDDKESKNRTEKKTTMEKKTIKEGQLTPASERTEVLIDKLPEGFDFQQLKERVSKLGDVKAVRPIKGGTKCFVEMKTSADAQKVIKDFNGSTMEGSIDKIRAVFCRRKKEYKAPTDAEKEAPKNEKESEEKSPNNKVGESKSKSRSSKSKNTIHSKPKTVSLHDFNKRTPTLSTNKHRSSTTALHSLKRKAPVDSSVPSKRFAGSGRFGVRPVFSGNLNNRGPRGKLGFRKDGYGSNFNLKSSSSKYSIGGFRRSVPGAAPHSRTISSMGSNRSRQSFGSGGQDFGLSRGVSNQGLSSASQGLGVSRTRNFSSGNQGFSDIRSQQQHQLSSGSFTNNRQQNRSSFNQTSNQLHFNSSRSGSQQDFGNNQRSMFQQRSPGFNKDRNQDITGRGHRDTLGSNRGQQEHFRGLQIGSSYRHGNQWSSARDDGRMGRSVYNDRQRRSSPQGRGYDRSRSRSPVGRGEKKGLNKMISNASKSSGVNADKMKMMMLTLSSMMVQSMKNKQGGSQGQERSRTSGGRMDRDDREESFSRQHGMDDHGGRRSGNFSPSFSRDQGSSSTGSRSMMGGNSYRSSSGGNYMSSNQQQWSQGSGGSGRSTWGGGFRASGYNSHSSTFSSSASQNRSSLTSMNTTPRQSWQRQGQGHSGRRSGGFQQGGRGERHY